MSRLERLKDAIEGECDGLAITDEQAKAILDYVDDVDASPSWASNGERLTLADCPIGLFQSENGELCLKTEYGNHEGRIDAYIVSSGEFFWGSSPQTIANQRKQMVRPLTVVAS